MVSVESESKHETLEERSSSVMEIPEKSITSRLSDAPPVETASTLTGPPWEAGKITATREKHMRTENTNIGGV